MTENPFRQVLAFDILRGVKLIQTTLSVNVWILQIRKRWNRRKQLSFVLAKVQHTRINIMSVLSLTQYDSKGLCLIKRSYDEKVTDYCLKIPEIFFSFFFFISITRMDKSKTDKPKKCSLFLYVMYTDVNVK